MSDETLPADDEAGAVVETQWWCVAVGDLLVWARLQVFESGLAEVLDSSGGYLRYDDATAARMALLDAEFRAFDGLDEDDAAAFGFDLDSVEPPRAGSDEDLLPLMTLKLLRLQ